MPDPATPDPATPDPATPDPATPDLVTPRRALLSASDRMGLVPFAEDLARRGVALISTGGTARDLRAAGLAVTEVSQVTGQPEMMDGRVKTLHPAVHGALLAQRDRHAGDMAVAGIEGIDLLVVNLYPFEAALARGADAPELVETIDIGGPAMVRAAAKNHAWVAVAGDAEGYAAVLSDLEAHGGTRLATRRALAARAFARTAAYDAAIAQWMSGWMARGEPTADPPRHRVVGGRLIGALRYGENPHQRAAFHESGAPRPGVATARQLQGKALSYNNLADADAAIEAVAEIAGGRSEGGRPACVPACVIVKHANPCGAALGESAADAHARALDCDRESAFGGIVALSAEIDEAAAHAIAGVFAEVVVAPAVSEAARAVLAAKPDLRVLTTLLPDPAAPGEVVRSVAGGLLIQERDAGRVAQGDLRVVTRRAPGDGEAADMLLAWRVAKHVRSNAIVLAKDGRTVGIGPGQTSRVGAVRVALDKAAAMARATGGDGARGAALASDAFFPFADGIEAAARGGVRAVIQPGGSRRDAEVIAAADAAGIAMAFTGLRHFRH